MPTTRSRTITEAHPVARYLFLAEQLGPNDTLVLEYPTKAEAKRAAAALSRFRAASRLGPPGSFEATEVDPKGEGIGYFDRMSVGVRRETGMCLRPAQCTDHGFGPDSCTLCCHYAVILSRIPEGQTSRRVRMPPPTAQRIEKLSFPDNEVMRDVMSHFFGDDDDDPPIPDLPDGALA